MVLCGNVCMMLTHQALRSGAEILEAEEHRIESGLARRQLDSKLSRQASDASALSEDEEEDEDTPGNPPGGVCMLIMHRCQHLCQHTHTQAHTHTQEHTHTHTNTYTRARTQLDFLFFYVLSHIL